MIATENGLAQAESVSKVAFKAMLCLPRSLNPCHHRLSRVYLLPNEITSYSYTATEPIESGGEAYKIPVTCILITE